MSKQKASSKNLAKTKGFLLYFSPHTFRGKRIHHKLFYIVMALVFLVVSSAYGISRWYMIRHADEPLQLGVTFIPTYTRYLEIDPQETMQAIIDDLGVKRFRLVSYWDEIEKVPGTYDFTELDWQFEKVKAANGNISLSIGLRQPRWPECHMPTWAAAMPKEQWYPHLKAFMAKVIERYKSHPSLQSYQLENEFFMKVFGICPDHARERLVDEYNFVKSLDNSRPVIITRSNNWGGVPLNEPTPDRFGIAVYKRVWDQNITHRYFEYPYPPWFYGFLAGLGEIISGKDMILHELQAEPWIPDGLEMRTSTVEEQNKSMNAQRLRGRFDYAKETGIRTIDLWGVEWWYWRKVHHNDPSLWNVAAQEFRNTD